MNKILDNFSLAEDKFMPQMDLRQKNKERIRKKKQTRDSRYIYQNDLDKVCF